MELGAKNRVLCLGCICIPRDVTARPTIVLVFPVGWTLDL